MLRAVAGVTAYHAGAFRLEKRFSSGFNLLSTYTWSKFLDNTNEAGSTLGAGHGPYSNFYNRRPDWGFSENDITHRFTLSSVYELPFGTGRRFLTHKPIRYFVGGWSVGTLAVIQSGASLTVSTQTNTTNSFSSGNLRADVLRNPNLSGGSTIARWFDTTAFQQPANYRFGNQGVGILRADGRNGFNFSVLRNSYVRETHKLQFRAEVF